MEAVPDNVIEFPGRNAERINGVKLHLGAMSIAELTQLQAVCKERVEEARTDLMVVNDYLTAAHSQYGQTPPEPA
jgi:hypothetical protein